ncbi:MAG: prenyltransferase/squalene oxidase repeat-containing protein, partial [Candidatus Heimdallarchaeota archaeon]
MTILIVAGTLFSELSDTNKVIRTQGGIRLSKSNNSAAYNNQFVEILPTTSAELLKRQRSAQFIDKTRLRSENSLIAIDQIFYRLASLKILDPALGDLNDATRQFWVNRVLVFQNPNGGFGEWEYDSSSISATYKALQILDWLGDTSINKSLVKGFLDLIRNTLTGGFNSHIQDADSDVISTYYGIASYKLLGLTIPNELDIKILLQKAQNLNPDTAIVPSNEFGGFGLQTNNQTVFWTSGVEATRAAVMGLDLIGSSPSNVSAAIDFTQGLQAVTIGGFIDTPNPPNSVTGAYTSSALDVVYALGGTPSFPQKAIDYLLSLELPDGSFSRKDTSSSSTLKATYFALNGLTLLGSQPANSAGTLNYILNWMPTGDGFGGTPGELPTLRETFDAV